MMRQWISVKDKLPSDVSDMQDKKQIKVLICTKNKTIKTALFGWDEDYNGNFIGWKFTRPDTTHWMPLPEPPTE